MKKKLVLLICALFLLSGCAKEDGTGVHTVTLGDSFFGIQTVTVDMNADTLTLDGVTYSYTKEEDQLVIRFTDEIRAKSGRDGKIVWNTFHNADYDDYRSLGTTLTKAYWLAYEDQAPPQRDFHPMMFLLGLGLIGVGVWHRRDPEAVFEARHWRYSNLEPSEDGLEVIRLQAWIFWLLGFVVICGSFG